MKCFKYGTAAGHDGITMEHLRYAVNTKLPLYLSHLLAVCLQFGEVPDAFRAGVLVPVLKKTKVDPGLPKNYRPITISAVPSKLLEWNSVHIMSITPCNLALYQEEVQPWQNH